jgi:F-type H+-transporting ATPase subunit b
MLFQIDGTFFVQLINFAIFLAVLNVIFLKPVGKAIRERREYKEGLVTGYDAAQAEATALRKKAEEVRHAAHRDADALLAKARAEASNETSAIATDYNGRAQAIVAEAQAKAAQELAAAEPRSETLSNELASLMLSRVFDETAKA